MGERAANLLQLRELEGQHLQFLGIDGTVVVLEYVVDLIEGFCAAPIAHSLRIRLTHSNIITK